MMRWKMGKMTHDFGIITLADSGEFEFEGPQKDFMERRMAELQEQRGLSGERALDAFMRDFSHGSYWFEEVK